MYAARYTCTYGMVLELRHESDRIILSSIDYIRLLISLPLTPLIYNHILKSRIYRPWVMCTYHPSGDIFLALSDYDANTVQYKSAV